MHRTSDNDWQALFSVSDRLLGMKFYNYIFVFFNTVWKESMMLTYVISILCVCPEVLWVMTTISYTRNL